jgi:hypothetical protein
MIFGALPLVIRLIVSFADPSGRIDHCSLSDFAFWGIMFNVAAVSNASTYKDMHASLFSSIVTLSLILISFFVAIYCISILPDLKLFSAWVICILLLMVSIIFSYFTTDKEVMTAIQMALEDADAMEKMHPLLRAYMQIIQDRIMKGENVEVGDGLEEFMDQYGFDVNKNTMVITPKETRESKTDKK